MEYISHEKKSKQKKNYRKLQDANSKINLYKKERNSF